MSYLSKRQATFFTLASIILSILIPAVSAGTLEYSTFLGSLQGDSLQDIAVDSNGNAYLVGATYGQASSGKPNNFPVTSGAFVELSSAFVTKLNNDGSGIIYSTLVGGIGFNDARAIVLDASGSAYVTGQTTSKFDFPTTTGAFKTFMSVSRDAVFFKLNPSGGLAYGTYLGGHDGKALAVDSSGDVYLTGVSFGSDFKTTSGALDTSFAGDPGKTTDAFFIKLRPAGNGPSDLLYATFLGNTNRDFGTGIAVDSAGIAHITGSGSPSATPGAFNTAGGGGFITLINPAGNGASDLVYSTFLASAGDAIALDASGNVYVSGFATSSHPTTPGAFDTIHNVQDGFVLKLNPAGNGLSDLLYSTFLAGASGDMVLDDSNNVYVTGSTLGSSITGSTLITTPDAFDSTFDSTFSSTTDVVIRKLTLAGNGPDDLLYSSYFGGRNSESGGGIAVDASGDIYVAGNTFGGEIPITDGAFQETYAGNGLIGPRSDGYVFKLSFAPPVADADGDGVIDSIDQCKDTPGKVDYQGCPVADFQTVDLHIIDQAKTGACGGKGSCKTPIEGAIVRVFDRNDANFQSIYGTKNPDGIIYDQVFENDIGKVGTCTTGIDGGCFAGEGATGDLLVIVKHFDAETGSTVYTGRPKSPSDFVDTARDADTLPDLATKEFQVIKIFKKKGGIQFSGGRKTVVTGSQLDLIYPDQALWDATVSDYVYPFILISDSEWTVDVCARVPNGYDIVGIYDAYGDLLTTSDCMQTFIAGESKVVAFDVIKTGSPPEWVFETKVKVKGPNGKVHNLELDIPSAVPSAARQRARGIPFLSGSAILSSLGSGSVKVILLLLAVVLGALVYGLRKGGRRSSGRRRRIYRRRR